MILEWARAHGYDAEKTPHMTQLLVRTARFEVLKRRRERFGNAEAEDRGGSSSDPTAPPGTYHSERRCGDGGGGGANSGYDSDDDYNRALLRLEQLQQQQQRKLVVDRSIVYDNAPRMIPGVPMAALRCRETGKLLVAASIVSMRAASAPIRAAARRCPPAAPARHLNLLSFSS